MIDEDYIEACKELNKEYSQGQIDVREMEQINWEEENTFTVIYKGVEMKVIKNRKS